MSRGGEGGCKGPQSSVESSSAEWGLARQLQALPPTARWYSVRASCLNRILSSLLLSGVALDPRPCPAGWGQTQFSAMLHRCGVGAWAVNLMVHSTASEACKRLQRAMRSSQTQDDGTGGNSPQRDHATAMEDNLIDQLSKGNVPRNGSHPDSKPAGTAPRTHSQASHLAGVSVQTLLAEAAPAGTTGWQHSLPCVHETNEQKARGDMRQWQCCTGAKGPVPDVQQDNGSRYTQSWTAREE